MKFFALIVLALGLCAAPSCSYAQAGVEVGGGYVMQSGWFIAPCKCTFAGGRGLGLTGSLSYDVFSESRFAVGMKSGIEYQAFTDYEILPGDIHTRIADGHHEQIKLTYLNFDPYVRYSIAPTSIFLQASPGISYLLGSKYYHVEDEEGIDKNAKPVMKKTRYSAKLSAGYEIPTSGVTLAPMITYVFPLNVISTDQADNWKVPAIIASITLRF